MHENIPKDFFEFLRFSIDNQQLPPVCVRTMDWGVLYKFAKEQSLLGIIYQGIERLPNGLCNDIDLLAKWTVITQKIRNKNTLTNERCISLQTKLHEDGFRCCILKGQGIAMQYPDASMRTSGDIDVWLSPAYVHDDHYPHRKSIINYVEQQTSKQKAHYHHIDFPIYKDVAVEVHFTPSFSRVPWINRRIQNWFERNADLQFSNKIKLTEGSEIAVPTVNFNLVYILSHIYRHLFSEGIGLRQLLDYYYVLKNTDEAMRKVARRDIIYLGMRKFATAVMWIMQEVFGLETEYLLFEPDEKEGRFLLNEVLIGGNFGKYDTRLGDTSQESFAHKHIRMTIRNFHLVKHYPGEALSEPIFRATQAIKEKLRRL